jgi:Holliday junction resolvase RusA-like endonuclease
MTANAVICVWHHFGMNPPIQPGESWKLVVFGHPTGQGSISAVAVMRTDERGNRVPVYGKNGYPITNVKDQKAAKLKPWRNEIAAMAVTAGEPKPWPALGLAMLDEPVIVRLVFYFARPDNHYGTGRNAGVLKDSAPLYPGSTGDDVDKLARSVLDALTGIVYRSDKRVVTLPARRRYGSPERVEITVRRPRLQTVGDLRRLRDLNPILAETLDNDLQLDLFAALPTKAVA